jgi:hypothetical protein
MNDWFRDKRNTSLLSRVDWLPPTEVAVCCYDNSSAVAQLLSLVFPVGGSFLDLAVASALHFLTLKTRLHSFCCPFLPSSLLSLLTDIN